MIDTPVLNLQVRMLFSLSENNNSIKRLEMSKLLFYLTSIKVSEDEKYPASFVLMVCF